MSENEIEDNIDQMRKLLSNIQSAESDIQIINNLQEMNKLNVISAVLRITGAGRQVETLRKHKGKVGELSSALVEKWNQDVRVETQMRIEAAKKVLPGDLSGADVEIVKEVTANMYGSSGYETLNKIGFAIINQEDSDFYQLLLFRPEQSTITLVNISRSFIFFVHQNQVISFTDEGNIRWRVCFDSQDDLNDFAKRLLLCKAMCGEEEVVSTDLVIGEGRGAELGDSLEVQMVVWEVDGIYLNKITEKKRLKFKLGAKNRFCSLKKNIVGMKNGARRLLIASTNNSRTAYDIKVSKVVMACPATERNGNLGAGRSKNAATTDEATAAENAADAEGMSVSDCQEAVTGEDNDHKVKEMMTNDITEDIRVNDGEHYDVLRNVSMQQLDNVKEKQRDQIRPDIGIRKKTFNQAIERISKRAQAVLHATEAGSVQDDTATAAKDDADEHATATESLQDDTVVVGADTRTKCSAGNKRITAREKKAEEIAAKNATLKEALAALEAGLFKSRRQCAEAFGLSEATLRRASNSEDFVFKGQGRRSEAMTEEEEKKVRDHIVQRLQLGVGLDLYQVQDLIQELLMGVVDANPERYVPWGDNHESPYRPPEAWVRRFLKRKNLKYRSSMHINGARARISREEVELWFEDVRQILFSDPELTEAMADPSRVFNWVSVSVCSLSVVAYLIFLL